MGRESNIAKMEEALYLIKKGFKNNIVQIKAGLSYPQVRYLRRDLNVESESINMLDSASGCLPSSSYIVKTRPRSLEAGLLLSLYTQCAEDPYHEIDMDALISAHDVYLNAHVDMHGEINKPITINEAYVLARDMRAYDETISMHRCQCGCNYIIVAEQRTQASCPLCSIEKKNRKTTKPSKKEDLAYA